MNITLSLVAPAARLAGRLIAWRRRSLERRNLLELDARVLADIGISRELLEWGVGAWPWRMQQDDVPAPYIPSRTVVKQAVAELSAYTDRELNDLGLTRGGIEDAVVYGRVGIERRRAIEHPGVTASAA